MLYQPKSLEFESVIIPVCLGDVALLENVGIWYGLLPLFMKLSPLPSAMSLSVSSLSCM